MKFNIFSKRALFLCFLLGIVGITLFYSYKKTTLFVNNNQLVLSLSKSPKVGFLPAEFSVAATGSPQYEIGIDVPEGTGDVEPGIKLLYNNSTSNGLLGYGWQLQGLSSITRIGKIIPQDGYKSGVSLTSEDRFALNGQRLIAFKDASGNLLTTIEQQDAAYGKNGTEYRTEVESWTKVFSYGTVGDGPSYFVAFAKDGSEMQFANNANSKIQPIGSESIATWAIDKIIDRNGNYVEVDYEQDKSIGYYVPSKISYTKNIHTSLPAQRLVKFNYENRLDSITRYIAGVKFSCPKRLKSISTYVDLDGDGNNLETAANLVRSYNLTYQYGSTKRSIVDSIQVCDAQGSCLPATKFKWSKVNIDDYFLDTLIQLPPAFAKALAKNVEQVKADFDGDGRMDIALLETNAATIPILFANSKGSFDLSSVAVPAGYSSYFNAANVKTFAADYNGDGISDLYFFKEGLSSVPIVSFDTNLIAKGITYQLPVNYNTIFNSSSVTKILGDIDGDGRADFLGFKNGYKSVPVLLTTATGFSGQPVALPSLVAENFNSSAVLEYQGADLNGDGLTDVASFIENAASLPIIYADGQGGFTATQSKFSENLRPYVNSKNTHRIIGDYNADGISDLALFIDNATTIPILYSTGSGGFSQKIISGDADNIRYFTNDNTQKIMGDINGDNITDIIGFSTGYKTAPSLISQYQGAYKFQNIALDVDVANTINEVGVERLIGDFNGDGLLDISAMLKGFTALPLLIAKKFDTKNNASDMVTSIEDGIGKRIDIEYLPITDSALYLGRNPVDYPLTSNQFANFVVSHYQSASSINNPTSVLKYDVKYEGATIDHYRGFLGFKSVFTKDYQRSLIIQSNQLLDFPYNGILSSRYIFNAEDNSLASKEIYTYGTEEMQARGIYTYWNSGYKMEHYTFGNYNYTLEKEFLYDKKHRDVIQINDLGDISTSDDDVFTFFQYDEYSGKGDWWKSSFPITEKILADTTNPVIWNSWASYDFSWKQFSYDSSMNVITKKSYVDNFGNDSAGWTGQQMKYDAYGNNINKIYPPNLDADSISFKIEFDSIYHTFPVKRTTAKPLPNNATSKSLVQNFQFDPRFNIKTRETDANGNITFNIPNNGIDGFGRIIKTESYSPNSKTLFTTSITSYFNGKNGGYGTLTQTPTDWENKESVDSTWLFTRELHDGFDRTISTTRNGTDPSNEWFQSVRYNIKGELVRSYNPQFVNEGIAIVDSVNGYQKQTYYQNGMLKEVYVLRSDTSSELILQEKYYYDSTDNRIVFVKSPSPKNDSEYIFYKTIHSSKGQVIEKSGPYKDREGKKADNFGTITYTFNALGQLTKVIDPLGEPTLYWINSTGNNIAEYRAETDTVKHIFNNNNWQVKEINALGTIAWRYDDLARPLEKYSISKNNKKKNIASYNYDDTNLSSNGLGNLSKITTPDVSYTYSYNNLDHINVQEVNVTELNQSYFQTFTYDPSERLSKSLLPDSSVIEYGYDYGGNEAFLLLNNDTISTYDDYDALGNAQTIEYKNGVHSYFSYDNFGRVLSSETKKGAYIPRDVSYTWNNANKLLGIKDLRSKKEIDISATYTYTSKGYLATAESATGEDTYQYDAAGNRLAHNDYKYTYSAAKKHQIEKISLNGITLNKYKYNDIGAQHYKSVILDSLTGNLDSSLNFHYEFDVTGNLNKIYEISSDTAVINQMVYNGNQLRLIKKDPDSVTTYYITENFEITVLPINKTLFTNYLLDDEGVVYSATSNAEDVTLLSGTHSELIKTTEASENNANPILQFINKHISWSMLFLLSGVLFIFYWVISQLVRVSLNTSRTTNTPGKILKIGVLGIAAWVLVTQNTVAAAVVADSTGMVAGKNGFGVPEAGEIRFYHHDQIGSNVLLTNETGGLANSVLYKPFGELDRKISTGKDNFRNKFTGKELDYYSGLQYFGSRYYDAHIGRFISTDPAQQYFSPYLYGDDDPLTGTDPNGELFFEIALIVSAIVFAYAGASLANGTIDPTQWKWDSAKTWVGMISGAVAGVAIVASGGAALASFGIVAAESVTFAGVSASTIAFTADIAFVAIDAYTFATEPSLANGVFLGLDLIPFAGALLGRFSKGAKAANVAKGSKAELSSTSKANRFTEVAEVCKLSFPEGTAVIDKNGSVAIENIKVGDEVVGYEESTGQTGLFAVSKVFKRVTTGIIIIAIGCCDTIAATPEHPFYTYENGWVEAQFLEKGSQLLSLKNQQPYADLTNHIYTQEGIVISIKQVVDTQIVVYNFEVEVVHNYFVGKTQTLVHNPCKKSARLEALGRTPGKGSRTGKSVISTMQSKGWIKGTGISRMVKVQVVKGGPRVWKKLDGNIHMGHIADAVDVWNYGSSKYFKGKPLYKFGAKSKQARKFMLDPKNYELEWGPLNSSNGAQLGITYQQPTGYTGKWPP